MFAKLFYKKRYLMVAVEYSLAEKLKNYCGPHLKPGGIWNADDLAHALSNKLLAAKTWHAFGATLEESARIDRRAEKVVAKLLRGMDR